MYGIFELSKFEFNSAHFYQQTADCCDSTMSKSPPKPTVTEGDAKVNIVDALCDLTLVTAQMSSAIAHLHNFVSDNLSDGTAKTNIMKQVKLIAKASEYTKLIIDDVKHIPVSSRSHLVMNRAREQHRTLKINLNPN